MDAGFISILIPMMVGNSIIFGKEYYNSDTTPSKLDDFLKMLQGDLNPRSESAFFLGCSPAGQKDGHYPDG